MEGMSASRSSTGRPPLRLVPPREPADDLHSPILAVILADGSIREVTGRPAARREPISSWASGSVAGEGWILWWERRSF